MVNFNCCLKQKLRLGYLSNGQPQKRSSISKLWQIIYSRKSVLESPEIIVKNPEFVFATSKGLFDGVLSRPHLKFFDLMDPFARGVQEVLMDQKDVETALNEVQNLGRNAKVIK